MSAFVRSLLFMLGLVLAAASAGCSEECDTAFDCRADESCYRNVCTPSLAEFNACDSDQDCNDGDPTSGLYCDIGRCRIRPAGTSGSDAGVSSDGGPVSGDAGIPAWTSVSNDGHGALLDLWGTAADNIWAVGLTGLIMHWNGSAWQMITGSPTTQYIWGVHGTSSTDIWAVGRAGMFLHYDGAAWSLATNTSTAPDLKSVWLASPTDGWAVGYSGAILRRTASAWLTETTTVANFQSVNDVWGTGLNNAWAVGDGGMILHFDGIRWTRDPYFGNGQILNRIHMSSPDNVWAVGDMNTIIRYDGIAWTSVNNPLGIDQLAGVYTVSLSDTWVVGKSGRIYHWDGTAWSRSTAGTGANLQAIWGYSPAELWVVGAAVPTHPIILRGPP